MVLNPNQLQGGICRSLWDVFMFTEGAQEITFHFLGASGFHFSSKHSRAGSDHPEIAGAESLKVHEGPELREPGLCGHNFVAALSLCAAGITLPTGEKNKKKNITNLLFAFLLLPVLDL